MSGGRSWRRASRSATARAPPPPRFGALRSSGGPSCSPRAALILAHGCRIPPLEYSRSGSIGRSPSSPELLRQNLRVPRRRCVTSASQTEACRRRAAPRRARARAPRAGSPSTAWLGAILQFVPRHARLPDRWNVALSTEDRGPIRHDNGTRQHERGLDLTVSLYRGGACGRFAGTLMSQQRQCRTCSGRSCQAHRNAGRLTISSSTPSGARLTTSTIPSSISGGLRAIVMPPPWWRARFRPRCASFPGRAPACNCTILRRRKSR